MYTLVYKDVLAILKSKATVPSLICIGAALVAMHGSSPVGLFLLCMPTYYFVAYSGMYDYKYAQERFYLSLPVSRSEWILSRYLSCLLVAFATLLLAFAAGSAGSFLGLPVCAPEAVDAVLAIFASCLTTGISLPFQFRLGYDKTRWINFIVMIVNSVAVSAAREMMRPENSIVTERITSLIMLSSIVAIALAVQAVSFAVSCALFAHREF